MLDEWKDIEAVVPSLDRWVALSADLPGDEVTLDADRWSQIVAVGGGATVGALGEQLGQGELPISRTVKELVELGLVSLGDVPASALAAASSLGADMFSVAEPEPEPSSGADIFSAPAPEAPTLTVVDDAPAESSFEPAPSFERDRFDPGALVIEPPSFESEASAPAPAPAHAEIPVEDELTDAAEIARQLANLSPKAAKAVAAAAKATTQEEREAFLAEVDDEEEPINRGLLLKFLGSVNG